MYPCASYVELVTMIWRNVEEDNPVQENPSKKKAKGKGHFSKQRKRGNDKKGSWFQDGNTHSALIVVRVDIRLRSVGHFIHTYV
jgi:hypothetical protein